jgi:hypothetical protein
VHVYVVRICAREQPRELLRTWYNRGMIFQLTELAPPRAIAGFSFSSTEGQAFDNDGRRKDMSMTTDRRVQKMMTGASQDGQHLSVQLLFRDGSEERLLFPTIDMPRVIEQLEQIAGKAGAVLQQHAAAKGRPMPTPKPARTATGYQASFAQDGAPVLTIRFASGLQLSMEVTEDSIEQLARTLQMLQGKQPNEPSH